MAGKKGMRHYPSDMKLRAVQMHLEEALPYAAITAALNIRDPSGRWKPAHTVIDMPTDCNET